ncbi:Integrase [Novosphingobium sp. CF614]|uniref:tyrosine-type recombinase/integrase n=1 Tax=Novosphingobium sp. CF614 TaxID=1884364 RepID=UPI0008EE5875|nr:site-specific integrase [Novosphingobium sp. CF614]SFG02220.1 Integrase [Novosphingobium sp. CF614]
MALSIRTIRSFVRSEQPGMWAARNGLNLVIAKSGSPSWALRYTTSDGRRRLMKMADYDPIDDAALAGLEAEAATMRKAIRRGHDPLAEREAEAIAPAGPAVETFKDSALDYIAANKSGWKNPKHAAQWENTLETYVYPLIGSKPTHEVSMQDVKAILQQPYARKGVKGTLWTGARETASRVRSRIEIVIKAAKAKALADNGNPARQALWAGHANPADGETLRLAGLNGKQVKGNFAAMDWQAVPAFVCELQAKPDYSAKALVLTILCATRTSETLNATWSEFDLEAATWTIPGDRMKMGREHRVPLSEQAVALLRGIHPIAGNPYVFPGARAGRPLSNMAMLQMLRGMRDNLTVHGFRSAFRDWITETTLHLDAIAEQALAHAIDNKVERAYRRGDAFERRRDLMQMWSDYLMLIEALYAEKWKRFIA